MTDTEQGLLWQSDGEDTHVAMSDAIPDAAFVVRRDNGGADWTVVDSDGALLPMNPPPSFDSLPVAKQWCQRREDDLFEQADDPEQQPEPVEPDPDMPPEPDEDTVIPEELLDALEDAKRYLDEAAEKLEEMTNRRKYAKNELDEAQEEFNRAAQAVIAVRTKGFPADSPLGQAASADKTPDEDEAPDSWRDTLLSDLRMPDGAPIANRYIEAMQENEPPIVTMGEFVDWCNEKGDFWAKDIGNFGDEGRRQVDEATTHFWLKTQQTEVKP